MPLKSNGAAIDVEVVCAFARMVDIPSRHPRVASADCLGKINVSKAAVKFGRTDRAPDRKNAVAMLVDCIGRIILEQGQGFVLLLNETPCCCLLRSSTPIRERKDGVEARLAITRAMREFRQLHLCLFGLDC